MYEIESEVNRSSPEIQISCSCKGSPCSPSLETSKKTFRKGAQRKTGWLVHCTNHSIWLLFLEFECIQVITDSDSDEKETHIKNNAKEGFFSDNIYQNPEHVHYSSKMRSNRGQHSLAFWTYWTWAAHGSIATLAVWHVNTGNAD